MTGLATITPVPGGVRLYSKNLCDESGTINKASPARRALGPYRFTGFMKIG
jgi:hypothetical protein